MHESTAVPAQVVILDLGPRGVGARPSVFAPTPEHRRSLDWVLHAFDAVPGADFYLVAGSQQEPTPDRYPELTVLRNPRGAVAGSVGSLFAAPLRGERECYVTRSDLVFRSRLVDLLAASDGDVVVAVDGAVQRRRGALVGIARLSPRAVRCLIEMRSRDDGRLAQASIPELVRELVARGLAVRTVESEGDWARLDAPQDLAHFVLGTKAESLERLRPLVRQCRIGPQVRCSVSQWRAAPQELLARVAACFGARPLAVRSSSRSEDDWATSRAGHFTSVLDVAPERAALSRAIDDVIASYGHDQGDHQVLIQEMLDSVQLSGVVFTRTLTQGAPYYTINYDDTTAHTGGVTGGAGKHLRTVVIHRGVALDHALADDPRLIPVLRAVRELEALVGHDSLDIEFVLDRAGEVHVLQLRPIVATQTGVQIPDARLAETLLRASADLACARIRGPHLVGRGACFGVMPDWNPAEIIGTCPRRLALSLYQHLITDEVWATQRAECGYRDVRPNPLLITIAGHPYVDIRVSLNSFIPASLDDGLAERLVDHYLQRLHRYPHLHDKVEFDIAFTCFAFDFEQRAREQLRPAGFTAAEIGSLGAGLQLVTQKIIGRYPEDLKDIERLERRYDALMQECLEPLDRASALLADCRRHGTLPFAHLARGAFVAVTLLRSLTAAGICSGEQQAAFLGSLSTVSRDFERDSGRVATGQMSWQAFVTRYRHLRPGTYEITSPSYGDDPERYLRSATMRVPGPAAMAMAPPAREGGAPPVWSDATRRAIAGRLGELGLPVSVSVSELEAFLRATIEGREWAKFVFTRNLSQALDDLATFALQHGCDREQLSHLDLQSILQIRNGMPPGEINAFIAARAHAGSREHDVTLCAQLPALVSEQRHLYAFERFRSQPNFVTTRRVVAPLIELTQTRQAGGQGLEVGGRLVLVPQADPGYDWLFGHPLAGLITMYGGANSHLAIRAAEANLPAAIGVGEPFYERLARARVLEMDCAGQQIRVVQ